MSLMLSSIIFQVLRRLMKIPQRTKMNIYEYMENRDVSMLIEYFLAHSNIIDPGMIRHNPCWILISSLWPQIKSGTLNTCAAIACLSDACLFKSWEQTELYVERESPLPALGVSQIEYDAGLA